MTQNCLYERRKFPANLADFHNPLAFHPSLQAGAGNERGIEAERLLLPSPDE